MQALAESRNGTDLATAESGSDGRAEPLHEGNCNVNRLCNRMYVHERLCDSGSLRTFVPSKKTKQKQ